MAHKKAAGTAKNLRDSAGRRLGIKLFAGQVVKNGNIICRQRGTKWRSGEGTKVGKDHTIYAISDGFVSFQVKKRLRYDGQKHVYTYIHVVSEDPNKKGATTKKAEASTSADKPKKVETPKVEEKKAEAPKAEKKVEKKVATTKKTTAKKTSEKK